jgi:insulysin
MIKSKYDKRKYKVIQLPNKLNIMIISDPNTTVSAVSMNVNIGCFQDPHNLPGLAHFLEHMLFMGTKKYPDINDFSDFLHKNGGYSNAFTSPDTTNYHFEINPSALFKAIDRFAHFFIDPLLNKKSVDKEINAVNSEHNKNLQNDSRRIMSILRILSDKQHPSHKFCTGNLETLKKDNIYDNLINFYKKWYSSNIMNLVILDKNPLNKIEKVIKIFNKIKNNNVIVPINKNNPFSKSYDVLIKPVNNIDILNIYWPINNIHNNYFRSLLVFITSIFNNKNKNSLYYFLKSNSFITGLNADYISYNQLSYYIFVITFGLTKKGINNINSIINHTYNYINYLNSIKLDTFKKIFKMKNKINGLNFLFKIKEDPIDYVSTISQNMAIYNKKYFLTGNIIMRKFDPIIIKYILKTLKNTGTFIKISKKLFNDKKNNIKKEYYYKTEYILNNNYFIPSKEKLKITLDTNNLFIPYKFNINNKNKNNYPTNIDKNKFYEVWFKQDNIFNKPFAYFFIKLISPITNKTAKNYVLNELLCRILNNIININLFDAITAGYHININSHFYGLNLLISGYNQYIELLIDKIFDIIINEKISQNNFLIEYNNLQKYYKNLKFNTPINKCYRFFHQLLVHNIIHYSDRNTALNNITYNDIIKYKQTFLSNLYIQYLVQGSLINTNIHKLIKKKINYNPINETPLYKIIKLNNSFTYIKHSENINDKNNIVYSIFQFGKMNFKTNMEIEVLHSIINEDFFNQLRTQEQLGYIVTSNYVYFHNIIFYTFIVQSSEKYPDFIQNRIDNFLNNFNKKIIKMTNNEFNKYVNSVIEIEQMKNINLYEEFHYNLNEINTNQYVFDRKKINIKHLKKIKKNDIINLFNKIIKKQNNINIHLYNKQTNNTTISFNNFKKNKQHYS